MTERPRRPNEVRGASVTLAGWQPGTEAGVEEAVRTVGSGSVQLDADALPIVVIEATTPEDADRVREQLEAAGAVVTVDDIWVTRERLNARAVRPACPSCGSARTQPFTHAGPAARLNMRCTECGHRFRHRERD